MLSKTSQYALRAMVYLARHSGDGLMSRATDVANGLGVPSNYLSKILHALGREGVLVSERGPSGGFRLARPADRISLSEVIGAFDELRRDDRCLLGRRRCRDSNPCAAHGRWKDVSERMYGFFEETTVADLLEAESSGVRTGSRTGGGNGAHR